MRYEAIIAESTGDVLTLTLNRPDMAQCYGICHEMQTSPRNLGH